MSTYELDNAYLEKLEEIAGEIQESEELSQYLEEEEEEYYQQLKELFEPRIGVVYDEVAAKDPLQLIPLEQILLDPAFEGLYLPKILGYSVLRGEFDENYKYVRPNDHFKEVLLAICHSANFDILKKRIGQSIQVGFALSSDIWITNLINSIDNKRVRYYLQGQKLEKYRQLNDRKIGYRRYLRQFRNDNFQTAEFPETLNELKVLFSPLKHFLLYRVRIKADNSSVTAPIREFIDNKEFQGTVEHLQIMTMFGLFFDLEGEQKHLNKVFNEVRKNTPGFDTQLMEFLIELHHSDEIQIDPSSDQRLSLIVDKKIDDKLSELFKLLDLIHSQGYNTEEVQEAIKVFYYKHQGLSLINEVVRQVIYQYFARYINNLEVAAYTDFFEISKLFPVYMGIFANQKFNQEIKELSMAYVARLLKHYTDKRGKDYQDIKKFVSTTFLDLGFLKEKEIVELFKTRRKRKKTA